MNHTFKKLIALLTLSMFILAISACSSASKTTPETLQQDVEDMVSKGKDEAMNIGNDLENRVEEAIKYIDTHAKDPFSDYEVTKKMAYYGSYLENVGASSQEAMSHEIGKLGVNVRSFISNVSSGVETEASEISTNLKNDITDGLSRINDEKDDMVHKFSEMIKKG